MLRRVSMYMLLLMVLTYSCQQQAQAAVEPTPITSLPDENWQLSYFNEPVFNSEVAVLEAGDRINPPIILIHGLGQLGMKDWFSVIPTLAKNYRVIAMDLPGFALSSGSRGRFLPTNYAHVIDAISKKYTNRKSIVIGHSMGGAIALRYTELYENSVEQLILVDAAGLLEKSAFIKHIASFEFGDYIPAPIQKLIDGANKFSSSMIEVTTKSSLLTDFLQNNDYAWNLLVSDSNNMNAALSLVEEDFSQAVSQISLPVNIIWGDEDNVAPIRTGKVLYKQMRNARLQVIQGAAHVPMKSHNVEFMRALEIALNQPITDKYTLPNTGENQGVLNCKGLRNKTYSGHYDEIVMDDCDNIKLINISADSFKFIDSVVNIENLSFANKDNQIEFKGSVATITNANISGHNVMLISGSRLDMAGVSIKSTGDAVMVANKSRISVSLSDISSPQYTGIVHGIFYPKNQRLIGQ
ncbi:alpha/beta hydrolase [uncultured Psychrosphaera sp.]|uniref:alpha/beta fold hydrolase n=1 Tax=uncultured Psychrosphaera sp. TaxID=1403522 RepID=UPI0026305856|nr:alpha/beta hydrolase [uncultured Psychrosphaera sp.]